MQFYNQLARSVGEVWRWKKIIIYEARSSITGQLFNIAINLNEYTVYEQLKQTNKIFYSSNDVNRLTRLYMFICSSA